MENNWNNLSEKRPDEGIEIICFNPEWIDEDFNPNGTRIGFMDGEGNFTTAHWWNDQDCYMTISKEEVEGNEAFSNHIQENTEPTHWIEIPKNPYYKITPENHAKEIFEKQGLDRAITTARVLLSYNENSEHFKKVLEILLKQN